MSFQCRQAGQEIEGNVMRTLFDLQNKNKVLHKCKSNYNQAEKKFLEVSRDVNKLEKEIKPEKREKSNKYQEKKKMHMTKLERLEDAKDQAIERLANLAANTAEAGREQARMFRSAVVAGGAIPELVVCLTASEERRQCNIDTSCGTIPQNPRGRTGFCGLGELRLWGVNPSLDMCRCTYTQPPGFSPTLRKDSAQRVV